MGGFFITNAPDAAASAARSFASKPVGVRSVRSVADVSVQHWGKQVASVLPGIHEAADGWILGFGTYYHRGSFGAACLPRLWAEQTRGFSVFSEVDGHFAFIVYRNGKLSVVTDKSGTYLVYVARLAEKFFISTSLIAIADALPRLTLGKQELLEFINVETTLGQKTIFQEIEHADAGTVIACDASLAQARYYDPRDERVDFLELIERFDAYHRAYREPDGSLCCDLSGGKDSRTVAALLAHAQVPTRFNTNRNVNDPHDHLVAQRVAACFQQPITMYENRIGEHDYTQLVASAFSTLDIGRNIYRAAYTAVYFAEKSRADTLVLGGYGGELLRDKYSRPTSLDQLIRKYYVAPNIWMPTKLYSDYRARLTDKFENTLRRLDETDIKKGVEKIYFFEKMRFWGGSHISAFNQYCYRAHPLLDHTLAKHYFDFGLADKADAKLQKRIIGLVPGLAEIPFSDQVGRPAPLRAPVSWLRARVGARVAKDLPPDLLRLTNRIRARGRFTPSERLREATASITPALQSFLSLSVANLPHAELVGRFATIAYTIDHFGSKVRGL